MRNIRELLKTKLLIDHHANPVVHPPHNHHLIADPTVITPDESPDKKFHMLAYVAQGSRLNHRFEIYHFTSDDGIQWQQYKKLFDGIRPFLFVENGFHLFYEWRNRFNSTVIVKRYSKDLLHWTDQEVILQAEHKWEKGIFNFLGNPCVARHGSKYYLYYSTGSVFLFDSFIFEPKYIGLAISDSINGPYMKLDRPIIAPDSNVRWRSLGAGAIRIISSLEGDKSFLAFNNGIGHDEKGRTRSQLYLIESADGINWETSLNRPVITSDKPWKDTSVYVPGHCSYNNKLMVYYNGRRGRFWARESIGLAILDFV